MLNHFFGIFPSFITKDYYTAKKITVAVILFVVSILVLAGFINTKKITVKNLSLTVNKKAGALKKLNIAVVLDIHLGTIIGPAMLSKIVNIKINFMN